MRRKDTFCKASRFEKGKAQENGITHARPDRRTRSCGCGLPVLRGRQARISWMFMITIAVSFFHGKYV